MINALSVSRSNPAVPFIDNDNIDPYSLSDNVGFIESWFFSYLSDLQVHDTHVFEQYLLEQLFRFDLRFYISLRTIPSPSLTG